MSEEDIDLSPECSEGLSSAINLRESEEEIGDSYISVMAGLKLLFFSDLGLADDVVRNRLIAKPLTGIVERENKKRNMSVGEALFNFARKKIDVTEDDSDEDSPFMATGRFGIRRFLFINFERLGKPHEDSNGSIDVVFVASVFVHELSHIYGGYEHVACVDGKETCDESYDMTIGASASIIRLWIESIDYEDIDEENCKIYLYDSVGVCVGIRGIADPDAEMRGGYCADLYSRCAEILF